MDKAYQSKSHHPCDEIGTDDILNLRTPHFDLEIIYGHKKAKPADKYARKDLLKKNSHCLRLGSTTKEPSRNPNLNKSHPNDFHRDSATGKAIIVDARSEENLSLAQLQIAFMKFHNAVVKNSEHQSENSFENARKIVIRHYQHIILKDFLPTFVQNKILRAVEEKFMKDKKNTFYNPDSDDMYLPTEFTVAALRFGHSMIRNSYNWNRNRLKKNATLRKLSDFSETTGVLAENKLRSAWIINWRWFFDIENSKTNESNFNFAKKIDTNYESTLGRLFPRYNVAMINSLSAIDLYRGVSWKLPSGQEIVAEIAKQKQLNIRTLSHEKIRKTLGGNLSKTQKDLFSAKTPLLYYLLAEAEEYGEGEKLGDLGSLIIAEVFLKLMYESPFSILKKSLERDDKFLGRKFQNKFGMAEMLKYTQKVLNKNSDNVIDPIGWDQSN